MNDSTLSETLCEKPSLSGGEMDAGLRHRRAALMMLLHRETDVKHVLELSHDPATGLWVYLIETPFINSWPRYVIGATDELNEVPEVLFRCGSKWAAREEWSKMTKDGINGEQP